VTKKGLYFFALLIDNKKNLKKILKNIVNRILGRIFAVEVSKMPITMVFVALKDFLVPIALIVRTTSNNLFQVTNN